MVNYARSPIDQSPYDAYGIRPPAENVVASTALEGPMVSTPKVVGVSLTQPDGSLKVSGSAQYTADLHLDSALSAACLRSPVPHARISSIDIAHAVALPGVKCVLTGRDIPEGNWGRRIFDMPVLAVDRV